MQCASHFTQSWENKALAPKGFYENIMGKWARVGKSRQCVSRSFVRMFTSWIAISFGQTPVMFVCLKFLACLWELEQ